MTTKPTRPRSELVRQRRSSQKPTTQTSRRTTSSTRRTHPPDTINSPVKPRRVASRTLRKAFSVSAQANTQGSTLRPSSGGRQTFSMSTQASTLRPIFGVSTQSNARGSASKRMGKGQRRNGYDYAFSLGRADVRAPALSLPQLGPRWVSAVLTLLLGFLLYTMWTASTFTVSAADVRGNQRLGSEDIYAILGMAGQPIFKVIPTQIETNLRTAFPDLASVSVHVSLPNHIIVDVVERMPILVWYQGGAVTWIDANGVAFMPRGDVQGLIQVASNGTPPKIPGDSTKPLYDQSFIAPEMVKAMVALSPYLPAGISMTYDPQYGTGWQDPRGWSVYFGQNTQDITMKLGVYQAIVDSFTRQGIQPTLISVEYLDAPFYK